MKNTRRFISAVMALAMVSALAPMSAFAIDQNDVANGNSTSSMTATYDVSAKYTITIPAGVTLSDTATASQSIEASDVVLESGKKITVKLTEASNTESGASFSAKTTKGDSTATYTIGKGEATTGVKVGDTVAEFTENGTQALTFSKAEGATHAGTHTETLTFGIAVEDVAVAVTGVTLDQSTLTLKAGGDTATLTATVSPDDATDKTVTWSSDNEAVATVANGVVTPVAAGTATITATAGGKSATCAVTVNPATITVTINQSDWGSDWNPSFTKDGVTVSAGAIDPEDGNLMDGGTFSTTLGNFTKIVVTTEYCDVSGTGWSGSSSSMTWAGTPASTVSFSGEFMGMGMTQTTIVCTIEPTN